MSKPAPAKGHMPFKGHRTLDRICRDCSGTISRMATHGRCRLCAARHLKETDPGVHERRAASHRQRWQDPVSRARMIAARRRHGSRQLGWCPPAYRDQYRYLMRSKKLRAEDARRILFDQVEADTRGLDQLAKALKLAGLSA